MTVLISLLKSAVLTVIDYETKITGFFSFLISCDILTTSSKDRPTPLFNFLRVSQSTLPADKSINYMDLSIRMVFQINILAT